MHFLMDFLLIQEHFTIVILQKYLLYSGLGFEFLRTKIHFLVQLQILKLHWKRQFSKYLGMPEMVLLSTNLHFRDHSSIDTFAILLLWSGLRLTKNPLKSEFFKDIFMLGPFSIKCPIVSLKIYHHRKEKSYRGSRDSFGNSMTRGTTWEGVEYFVVAMVKITIALVLGSGLQWQEEFRFSIDRWGGFL